MAVFASLMITGAALAARPSGGPPRNENANRPHKKVCQPGNNPNVAHCHSDVITQDDGVTPLASTNPSSSAYKPADLESAYALPGTASGAGQTVAIVDAYDNPNAENDL